MPSFEVASVKAVGPGEGAVGFKIRNGQFMGQRVTLRLLVAVAYGLQDFQVTGGPNWIDSNSFDVEAKGESGRESADEVRLMLQELLADRFKLTVHRETKESTVLALVVGKRGVKMKPSSDQTPGAALGPHGALNVSARSLVGTAVPLQLFASVLGRQLGRTVLDRTGLSGRFDFALRWTPDSLATVPATDVEAAQSGSDSPWPSVFTAVEEQLGLELQATRGPAGYIVIDRVEKPQDN
jgi:bla regulator protein blaR1